MIGDKEEGMSGAAARTGEFKEKMRKRILIKKGMRILLKQ